MKTLRFWLFTALVFGLALCGSGASADEIEETWINPAYQDVPADKAPKASKFLRDGETFYVSSYSGFKSTVLDKVRNRMVQFNINVTGFPFSEVVNFPRQFNTEIESEDPYASYNVYSSSWSVSGSGTNVTIYYGYTYWTTYDQEQYVSQRVTQILGEIITSGMNDEQKVKAIHDWVVKNVQYDTSLVRHSAYEALYSKTTVCQGYALLMFRMLKDSGINGRIVSGGNHGWNLLYLCGNYYHLDATWDDPVPDVPNRVLYNYYNKSDSYMAIDHTWTAANYPAAPIAYVEGVCSGSQTYTISGYITGTNSVGVSGVTLTLSNSGGTVTTDTSGYYSKTVSSGWSGTVTPSKSGYTFTPTSKSYSNVTANQSSQNYTAATSSTPSYTISGYVTTSSGTAISGVTMTSSSAATASTDSSGYYSLTVSSGWTGTVTPSKSGYTFAPTNKSYSSVSANQSSQNYTGTAASSGNLVWQTSQSTAVSMAISQGKKILLLAGRETCGYTQYMKYTACESLSPPIKALIEQYFIPWFCDVDNSTEWYPYASGLSSITLPMICVIDPNNSNTYLDRTTGMQDIQVFYSRLSQYTTPGNSYTISGQITDLHWVGVSGITLTFSNNGGTATTDTNGYYSQTVPSGWSGTVTPSKSGWTFTPVSKSYSNVTANQTSQDFDAWADVSSYTISGYITDAYWVGVSGITLTFSNSGGTVTTDSEGYYSQTVSSGWSGTVTPSKSGWTFTPVSRSYSSVAANQTSQNFDAWVAASSYTISGYVYDANTYSYLSGVTLTLSTGGTAATDTSGYYSLTVASGWSGTVTPSKSGYTFIPKSYTDVLSNISYENYAATPIATSYTISGYVTDSSYYGISGVTLTFSGGSGTVATDSSGYYSKTVSVGWSGTVAPSKSGYTFTPVSKSYSSLAADQTNQNYTGMVVSAGSFVIRTLPTTYTPGVRLTVTLKATPPAGTSSYVVEDTPPYGWTPSNYSNMNGSYDSVNRKLKFFSTDGASATFTYDVTPPSTETGDKTFTGIGRIGTSETAIGGQSGISKQQNQYHPADKGSDFGISGSEFSEYLDAWSKGLSWSVSPSPIPTTYMLRAASLWQMGEDYKFNSAYTPPGCWETLSVSARNSLRASSTAIREMPATYQKGQSITISVTATPNEAVIAYVVEETLPGGWTNVSDISSGGKFANGKVTFGPFMSSSGNMPSRTLSYTVTVPADATGIKTFTGTATFDKAEGNPEVITVGGKTSASDGSASSTPGDLDGINGVDLADVMIALKILDGIPVSNVNIGADVNGDNKIDHVEAIYVLQKVAALR